MCIGGFPGPLVVGLDHQFNVRCAYVTVLLSLLSLSFLVLVGDRCGKSKPNELLTWVGEFTSMGEIVLNSGFVDIAFGTL